MTRPLPIHWSALPAMVAIAGSALTLGIAPVGAPAGAQLSVFDPTNYSQNILTAARALQQVNNQIQMLQNQAQSLANQARNLTTVAFPELQAITNTIGQIDSLMGQAQAIRFRVDGLDQQVRALFPASFDQALTGNARVAAARARLDASLDAYRQTMHVQAQVVENLSGDAAMLNAIVARSQSAQGALQASQAANQLLALVAKQQFQLQTLLAAQYRADAIEQAGRALARSDAQGATAKFLGSGSAYTPH